MALQVFTNHTDTVIAADLDDVRTVVEAHYGSTLESEGWSLDDWGPVEPDKVIKIHNYPDEGLGPREMLAREWIGEHGRGFLCSTEW